MFYQFSCLVPLGEAHIPNRNFEHFGSGLRSFKGPGMCGDVAIDGDGCCDSWFCSLGFRALAEGVIPICALD
jgi:hypothetical protein